MRISPINVINGATANASSHAPTLSLRARRFIMADISALSADSAWWSSVDIWALIVVAIGVVIEGIAEWLPKERREMRLTLSITRTGWLILVLALVGEFIAQHNKDADDALIIAALYDNTGRLGITIDNLHNFVEQKEKEAHQQFATFKEFAKKEKVRANTLIAQLNSDKTDLKKARNDAQEAARAAKNELSAIRTENMPRSMNPSQQHDFISRMKAFAGLTANVSVYPSSGRDAGPLADLLRTLLRKAGWKVDVGFSAGGWAKSILVCIGPNAKSNVTEAATAAVVSLRQDRILAFIDPKLGPDVPFTGTGNLFPKPDMTIIIGAKQQTPARE